MGKCDICGKWKFFNTKKCNMCVLKSLRDSNDDGYNEAMFWMNVIQTGCIIALVILFAFK